MTIKQAQKIEVGMSDGRLGFTIEYTDGERAHFVFAKAVAKGLGQRLLALVTQYEEQEYIARQMRGLTERVGISDCSSVRLTEPPPLDESGPSTSMGMTD
jgi:hypothetical protein